jgi:hypothetical protein
LLAFDEPTINADARGFRPPAWGDVTDAGYLIRGRSEKPVVIWDVSRFRRGRGARKQEGAVPLLLAPPKKKDFRNWVDFGSLFGTFQVDYRDKT